MILACYIECFSLFIDYLSEIITYGGREMLVHVFNAIAMLVNGKTGTIFRPLMFIGGTIGALWAFSKAFWESSINDLILKWLIPMSVLVGTCLIPTATVRILDPVAGTPAHSWNVDNVPFGLARAAQMTSSIGYSSTSLIETAFKTPDHQQYNKTGMIFGAENLLEMSHYAISDEILARNMRDFVHNCVTFDVLFGKYSMDELKRSGDIWKTIREKTSSVRMFTKCEAGKSRCTLVSCRTGANDLHTLLKTHIDGLAAHHILGHLPNFYSQLTGMAEQAATTISQQVMMHTLIDAIERKCDSSGLGTNFAVRRAYMQQRHTYEVAGALAAKSLVVMRNILEALLYASFIFIMPLALMPMGFRIFFKWLWLLIWIQLWPPLYAILNCGIMVASQANVKSMIGIDKGLTILTSTGLNNLALDMQTYAAYASLSIPLIAYAILQGGISSFVQLSSSLAGVSQSVGSTAAQEQTTGNYNYGQVGLETSTAFTQTMHQHQKSTLLSSGFYQENRGDHSTIHGSHRMVMNDPVSQLPFELNASNQLSQNLRQSAQNSETFASQEREALNQNTIESNRVSSDWVEHTANNKNYDNVISQSTNQSVSQSSQEILRKAESWGKQYNLSAKESLSILSNVGLGIHTPVLKMGKDRQEATGVSQDELLNSAKQFTEETGFTKSYQDHVSMARNQSVNNHDEVGKRFSHTLGELTEKSHQHQTQIEKHTQRSTQLSKTAEDFEQKSVIWNQKLTQEFVDDLANEKLSNGHVRGRQMAQHILRYSPHERDIAVERFLQKKEKALLSQHDLSSEFQQKRTAEISKPLPKILAPKTSNQTIFAENKKHITAKEKELENIKLEESLADTILASEKNLAIQHFKNTSGKNLAKQSSALLGRIVSKNK